MSINSGAPTPLVQEALAEPASFLKMVAEAGEKALRELTAQAALRQATRKVTHNVTDPATFVIPTLGNVDLSLPTAREAVEAHFVLVDKYVSNQKAYAEKLLAAVGG